MYKKFKNFRVIIVIFLLIFILGSNLTFFDSVRGESSRTGAWVDRVNIGVVDSQTSIDHIKSGNIDMYAGGLVATEYSQIQYDPSIDVGFSNGLYYELTLNPAVFYDTNKLNPFTVREIREAMNWLMDRDYLNQTIYGNIGLSKFFSIVTNNPDYVRYSDKVTELEAKYAYNPVQAETIIASKMITLGATKVSGKWYYKSQPVTIILLIRNDSDQTRIPIGDYVADQLESIGFTTDRQYVTSSQASPLWVGGDPADGLWHIYTGAWSATIIDRDEGDNFEFFNSPYSAYGWSGLWQSYNPTTEFLDIMDKLAYNKFSTMEERDILFNRALELELEFAVRIWLIDGKNIVPRRATITVANDLAAGESTPLWPFTIRHREVEGGTINIGGLDLFVDPWNPIAGSNWAFDDFPRKATADIAIMPDPDTGLYHPQRVESAEVYVKTGLPVHKTLDWVTLSFMDSIQVPDDAWVAWDAAGQKFLTASQVDPLRQNRDARIKSVVIYPDNLFPTVTWHDGSPLDMADFILAMIMKFDRGNPASSIYDPAAEANLAAFLSNFKGVQIISENPLKIETYWNSYQLDAELNVTTWWPEGDRGPLPWHTTALAAYAEEQGLLAFSAAKAGDLGVPWINYLNGDTLNIMSTQLSQLTPIHYLPYPATMNAYLSESEVDQRWSNLANWYSTYGHFWVGSGAFYIDDLYWNEKVLSLARFEAFPDPSDKWEMFQEGSLSMLAVDFSEGAPGSTFTIVGSGYPPNSEATIYVNFVEVGAAMTDSEGGLTFTLTIPEGTDPGLVLVTVSVNPTYSIWLNIDPEFPVIENTELSVHIEPTVINPLLRVFLPLTTK